MNFMKDDYNLLMHHGRVKRSSTIYNLSPIMRNGLVCVGGRLQYSGLPENEKHQVIIPKDSQLNEMIIKEIHKKGHTGTEYTLASIRRKYWLILPPNRLDSLEPPFTYTGTDGLGLSMLNVDVP